MVPANCRGTFRACISQHFSRGFSRAIAPFSLSNIDDGRRTRRLLRPRVPLRDRGFRAAFEAGKRGLDQRGLAMGTHSARGEGIEAVVTIATHPQRRRGRLRAAFRTLEIRMAGQLRERLQRLSLAIAQQALLTEEKLLTPTQSTRRSLTAAPLPAIRFSVTTTLALLLVALPVLPVSPTSAQAIILHK